MTAAKALWGILVFGCKFLPIRAGLNVDTVIADSFTKILKAKSNLLSIVLRIPSGEHALGVAKETSPHIGSAETWHLAKVTTFI